MSCFEVNGNSSPYFELKLAMLVMFVLKMILKLHQLGPKEHNTHSIIPLLICFSYSTTTIKWHLYLTQ